VEIALIAPPWPLFNRPSIQLAALAAFIRKNAPSHTIRAFHPYLFVAEAVGFGDYHAISQSGWASEAVCAGILFPEMSDRCDRLFRTSLRKRGGVPPLGPDPRSVREKVALVLNAFIESVPWRSYGLVGISVSINQLTAALYLARRIKKLSPETPLAIGGPGCAGMTGPSLLSRFPEIDYVIHGEGELPLIGLIQRLAGEGLSHPSGVSARGGDGTPFSFSQVLDMDSLPCPDFDDFFQDLTRLPPEKGFRPVLPVEMSRGCWWGRCAFCNLNLQWSGYRMKSVERMTREIDTLSRRYGTIDFAFMDNALPRREAPQLFSALLGHGRDYRFFAELRAVYTREEWAEMARGGLREVQVGIEALSTSLLKRLGKGTRAMDNVAAMRHAEEHGIRLSGNLILHFPGSTEDEVRETLDVLRFVRPFRPLKAVSFWLGTGSAVEKDPARFKVTKLTAHPSYADLFPMELASSIAPFILSYRGDRRQQQTLWKEVEKELARWQRDQKQTGAAGKLLTYRDGKEFMEIRQVLPDGRILTHRLTGLSREIYLACQDITPWEKVTRLAKGRRQHELEAFISGLVKKRLMFREGNEVLSLAIRLKD